MFQGFYDPGTLSFTYPKTAGQCYSFTDDGFWEQALYLYTANRESSFQSVDFWRFLRAFQIFLLNQLFSHFLSHDSLETSLSSSPTDLATRNLFSQFKQYLDSESNWRRWTTNDSRQMQLFNHFGSTLQSKGRYGRFRDSSNDSLRFKRLGIAIVSIRWIFETFALSDL